MVEKFYDIIKENNWGKYIYYADQGNDYDAGCSNLTKLIFNHAIELRMKFPDGDIENVYIVAQPEANEIVEQGQTPHIVKTQNFFAAVEYKGIKAMIPVELLKISSKHLVPKEITL